MILFPNRHERLRREASSWVARLQGPASEADRAAFERWRDADPAHGDAYERIVARYDAAGLLARSELARGRTLSAPPAKAGAPRPYALAAGLAALLLVSGAILLGRPEALMAPAEAERLFLATTIGEIREFPLPDGSRVTLDTESRVEVEMRAEVRQVTLRQGRARITMAAEEPRPFVVNVGAGRVRGREGTFDVSLRGGEARVQPLEGSVTVETARAADDTAAVSLQPGQVVSISAAGDRIARQDGSRIATLWPTGRIEFDDTPMAEALAEANRYSRAQIRLGDPALARLRVTGIFQAGDLDGFARSLAAAFGLRLERSGAELVLRSDAGRDRPGATTKNGG